MPNTFKFAATATAAILAFSALSGCLSTANTASGIRATTDADSLSVIPVVLRSEVNGRIGNYGRGGVVYVTGISDTAMVAYAGVVPGANVGPAITSGTATYGARYQLDAVKNIEVNNGMISGYRERFNGNISLTADFNSGTLTGNSQHLRVNARIADATLTGTTHHNGIEGTLDGVIGTRGTIGAFAGHSATSVYAGGFVAPPPVMN